MTGTRQSVPGIRWPVTGWPVIYCAVPGWLVPGSMLPGRRVDWGNKLPGAWLTATWLTGAWWSWLLPGDEWPVTSDWLSGAWWTYTMGAFKPPMLQPKGSYPGSIALRGGAPIGKELSLNPTRLTTFFSKAASSPWQIFSEYSLCLIVSCEVVVQI